MSTELYRFSFRMNASHGALHQESVHSHTFEITLFLNKEAEPFVTYDKIETIILSYLKTYTNVVLNQTPPFDSLPSTIENMGDEFFLRIAEKLSHVGYHLVKLEISENPQRIYSVSAEEMDTERRDKLEKALLLSEKKKSNPTAPSETVQTDDAALPETRPDPVLAMHPAATALSTKKNSNKLWFTLSVLVVILAGLLMMLYVRASGVYPLGLDIHGHLFKADFLYNEISKGNFYPLYTHFWYNGTQLFRYWAPFPYFFLAIFQFLCKGDIFASYLCFIWMSFSVGGIGWLLFGRKLERPGLGLFFAMIWFMLPDNLRVFFGEGNFLRMFITMLLPYTLYCLWQFVEYRRKKMILPLIILMVVHVFSHLMISAMIGVACAIYLLVYAIANKRYQEPIQALAAMFFSFAVAGIWVYPSLVGGLTAMSSSGTSELMASLSAPLTVSLNPLARLGDGITELYYGLSIMLIAVLGLVLSNRKSFPGFLTFVIIVLASTTALTPLIQLIPMSELFWVRRFTPIVYAMFLISLFEWRKLKKPILVVACILLTIDCIFSFNLEKYESRMNLRATANTIEQTMDDTLFSAAKESTKQRVSLMDLSLMGPMPSYAFCSTEKRIDYVFGWAWQSAATASNIAYLNEAFERENYLYVFDRNLELGADTVIIDKTQVGSKREMDKIIYAADRVGYTLSGETEKALMYSFPVNSNFGVISNYNGLAIGTTAELVPGILPSFHPGDKRNIDDYTADELIEYDMLYLSGFFYKDKAVAESIVREAADSGVQVYIDMSRIPTDPLTNRMTFLNVSAQPITFWDRYPSLITDDMTTDPIHFAEDYEQWNTVYLTELANSEGYAWFEGTKLDFVGKSDSENITFIGFNLLFHAYTADDTAVKNLFDTIMSLDEYALPQRRIVPIEVSYDSNQITIVSPEDNVNTSIAYQDIFKSEQPIREMNNFLIVDKGTTIITMEYPYLIRGIIVSSLGVLIEAGILYLIFRKRKHKTRKPHPTAV